MGCGTALPPVGDSDIAGGGVANFFYVVMNFTAKKTHELIMSGMLHTLVLFENIM